MRKLVSVLVIAVMVLALAAPAFAADSPSPTPPASGAAGDVSVEVPVIGDAIGPDGQKADVVVTAPELAPGETLESVAKDAVKAAEDAGLDIKDATAAEVFDIEMSDGTQPDGSVKVTIVRSSSSGDIAAVMYQAEDGTWDSAKFTDNGDGTVTITFEHFCTVVLLVKEPTAAPDVKPTPKPEGGSTGSTASSEPTSPKTGYDD